MKEGFSKLRFPTSQPPAEVARRLTSAIVPSRVFFEWPFVRKPVGGFAGYVDGNRFRLRGPSPAFSRNFHAIIEGVIHPVDGGSELEFVCRPAIPPGVYLTFCLPFVLGGLLIIPQAGVCIGLFFAALPIGTSRLSYLLVSRHAAAEAERAEHFLKKLLSAR